MVYPVGRSTDRSLFMGIIIYNYKDLSDIFTKFSAHICLWLPYMCAKFQLDRSMRSRVRVVFVFVRKEEKTETLITRMSEMAGAIYFKFKMYLPVIGGHFHRKFGVLQIKDHRYMNV